MLVFHPLLLFFPNIFASLLLSDKFDDDDDDDDDGKRGYWHRNERSYDIKMRYIQHNQSGLVQQVIQLRLIGFGCSF